ncbi:MAG: lactate utilization protein [Rhodospirillum sp.]|nr:lactate utilization protein [Rhodospirillum sp.]MCF8491651.1 lactate utilization protein [Rhodospirillum sp.]MCF8501357.1 lactate utilization protein [Rhodospirillum sp.]
MTAARDAILGGIRRSLRRGPLSDAEAVAGPRARLDAKAPILVPERAKGSPDVLVDRFLAMAIEAAATVDRIQGMEALPGAIASYLKDRNLSTELVTTTDPEMDGLVGSSLEGGGLLTVKRGLPSPTDTVSVVPALRGVAETGTVMLRSGETQASTLNFLPETHIVVLKTSDIVGGLEEAWAALRAEGPTPRTVNFITGPSRTGDIEQTLQMGAHGPLRLHILLVDETP